MPPVMTRRRLLYIGIVLVYLVLRKLFYSLYHKYKHYPRGPGIGFPFFGYFFHLLLFEKVFLTGIAKKYGKIVYIPVGMNDVVYINESKLVFKLMRNKEFYHRFPFINPLQIPVNFGMIKSNKEWIKRRSFAQKSLFSLCDSSFILKHTKYILKNEIFDDLNTNYISTNSQKSQKLWFPTTHLSHIAFNNIFTAIFDKSLPMNDKWLNEYIKQIEIRNSTLTPMVLLNTFCPFKLPKFIINLLCSSHHKSSKIIDESLIKWMQNEGGFIIDFDQNIIQRKQIKKNICTNKTKNMIYIDLLIKEIENGNICVMEAIHDIQALIYAGLDSTNNTSEFGLILLTKYTKIQEEIYVELKNVMEKQNKIDFDFSLVSELHIFRAFIYEMLRISDAVPIGIPHTIYKDFEIQIINDKEKKEIVMIPSKSMIHINSHFINKYQSWKNDECKYKSNEDNDIHLEYWLDEENQFKMNPHFVSFGAGKRDCVGRGLAIKVLYAIFGLLMLKYKFIASNNNPNNTEIKQKWGTVQKIEPKIGIIIQKRK